MTVYQPSDRFMRPPDVRATRRNHHRVQIQKMLVIAANVLLAVGICLVALWIWQRSQHDERFAVRAIQPVGATKTTPSELASVARRYVGMNLFQIDLGALQREFQSLPWVADVAIEKQLPGTLKVHVTEREPVALLVENGKLLYVDREARPFARLAPRYGNPELPLVRDASKGELSRAVAFLARIRRDEPELYSRISEVSPLAPESFVIFDRSLSAPLFVRESDAAAKWRELYRIAGAESLQSGSIAYADLRFNDRIVIKPRDVRVATVQ
jgi:cell division protein FtsQ